MRERLWRIVSSLWFVNAVHDLTLVWGMIFVVFYIYWLFEKR
jgi:hypothetical protein